MPWKTWAGLLSALLPSHAFAELDSYHIANPIGVMHDLPVGSTPGWSGTSWFNLETSMANTWNHEFDMTDTRNGNQLHYFADYEQETVVANVGVALTSQVAFSVEVPYNNHNGGFSDDAVDHFHQWLGTDRFTRDVNPKFGNHFVIRTNGEDRLTSEHAEGAGNIKTQLKYWFAQWRSPTPGACDCGLAVSGQVKFPIQTRDHGLSSGTNDYTGLVHMGIPIASASGVWATAAFTKLGRNDVFADWPKRDWAQMYELSLDLAIAGRLGLILQARYESPLFNKEYLSFNYTTSGATSQVEERIVSGWNALVEWRGSEDIGLRWRWGKGSQINFLFVEDWGIGPQDESSDGLYINNAPDFQFVTQWHFVF
jgi:hypothetical protein